MEERMIIDRLRFKTHLQEHPAWQSAEEIAASLGADTSSVRNELGRYESIPGHGDFAHLSIGQRPLTAMRPTEPPTYRLYETMDAEAWESVVSAYMAQARQASGSARTEALARAQTSFQSLRASLEG
jgi:hypothetical protein